MYPCVDDNGVVGRHANPIDVKIEWVRKSAECASVVSSCRGGMTSVLAVLVPPIRLYFWMAIASFSQRNRVDAACLSGLISVGSDNFASVQRAPGAPPTPVAAGVAHGIRTPGPRGSVGTQRTSQARVAEWQTRWTQNPLSERVCGFESRPGHDRDVWRRTE
jgi:hypothetical protein